MPVVDKCPTAHIERNKSLYRYICNKYKFDQTPYQFAYQSNYNLQDICTLTQFATSYEEDWQSQTNKFRETYPDGKQICAVSWLINSNCWASLVSNVVGIGLAGLLIHLTVNGKLSINRVYKSLIGLIMIRGVAGIGEAFTVVQGSRIQELGWILFEIDFSETVKQRVNTILWLNGFFDLVIAISGGFIEVIFSAEYFYVAQMLKNHELKKKTSKKEMYCIKAAKYGGMLSVVFLSTFRVVYAHTTIYHRK